MKYVVFDGYLGEEIMVFNPKIQHSFFAEHIHEQSFGGLSPVSGGFVVDGKCVGESESLGMKSREKDTELLKELINTLKGESK